MPSGLANEDHGGGRDETADAAAPPPSSDPRTGENQADTMRQLAAQRDRLREEGARLSESTAEEAEKFADQLERSALRGDRRRRMDLAGAERLIAGIERRNAGRLRGDFPGTPGLESLPDLPGYGPTDEAVDEPPGPEGASPVPSPADGEG